MFYRLPIGTIGLFYVNESRKISQIEVTGFILSTGFTYR